MKVSNIITPKARAKPYAKYTALWIVNDDASAAEVRRVEEPGSDVLLVTVGPDGRISKDLSKYDMPNAFVEAHEVHTLTSLVGMPRTIQGMYANTAKDQWGGAGNYGPLSSMEGAPLHVVEEWDLNAPGITSLQGIGQKFLQSCRSIVIYPDNTSHLLGILRIAGLQRIRGKARHVNDPWLKVPVILEKHLDTRDILACQEELIDAGFEEAAQL